MRLAEVERPKSVTWSGLRFSGLGLGLGLGLGVKGLELGLEGEGREAEVGHPRHVVRAEQHVLGLEVEVDDIVRVHGLVRVRVMVRLGLGLG